MIETLPLSGNFSVVSQCEDCAVYQTEDGGTMTAYTVFPGILVTYNDVHTEQGQSRFYYAERVLTIDHCRKGRIEWERRSGTFSFLGESDVQISTQEANVGSYSFPTSYYHGITIHFYLERAQASLARLQDIFSVDLRGVWEKFGRNQDGFIMRADQHIQHIFSELYHVDSDARIALLRLKVIELLLYLSRLDAVGADEPRPYFQKAVVERVKAVKEQLCAAPAVHIPLPQLAREKGLSETALRQCFKEIYGEPVYTFVKRYRLHWAAEQLRTTAKSVLEIAVEVGYENPSKFTAAFKQEYGITPLKFRKRN